MDYQLQRVAGAVHSAGNVLFDSGDRLFSAVGNRVACVDLRRQAADAVGDFEARGDIDRLALTSDGCLLCAADIEGRLSCVHTHRRVVLHRLHLGGRAADLVFSPDDGLLAVAVKNRVQLWRAPARRRRDLAPFARLRQFGGFTRPATCLTWSADASLLACGSQDNSVRVFRIVLDEDLDEDSIVKPYILAAHKASIVRCFFANNTVVSCARDCVVAFWELEGTGVALALKKFLWEDANDGEQRRYDGQLVDAAASSTLLACAFSTGVFAVYDMSGKHRCACVHRLSVARGSVDAIALDATGSRVALASRRFGQLVVWDWRSETFVLKQQGHDHEAKTCCWSPDGRLCVSGADDRRVKVWSDASGFCFATFADHQAPVTAVACARNVVFSASRDGTVRAYDLRRYRQFRVFKAPPPRASKISDTSAPGAPLVSLAVDADAELVCAGGDEPFEVYVWSVRSGQLLDALAAHEGPVCALALDPRGGGGLASGSWDKTVRLWKVYRNEMEESLEHSAEVLAVAYRRDGGQLVVACLDGALHVWNSKTAKLLYTIDGSRDLAKSDRFLTKRQRKSEQPHFTCVAYSADGERVLAGGSGRFVCCYAVTQQVLVAKFRVSHRRDDSDSDSDGGPMEVIKAVRREYASDDDDDVEALPGSTTRRAGNALSRDVSRVNAVAFSPTGVSFCACTPGALLFYRKDDATAFAPFDVDEAATPESARQALAENQPARALAFALALGHAPTLAEVVSGISLASVDVVVRGLPPAKLPRLLRHLAACLASDENFEFYAIWLRSCLRSAPEEVLRDEAPVLREATRSMLLHKRALSSLVDDNENALAFILSEGGGD